MADLMPGDPLAAVRPAAAAAPSSEIIAAFNHGFGKPGLIPLWAGEGDLPTPAFIAQAAARSLDRGETYYTPSRGIPELRGALARYYERQYGRPFDPEAFFVTQSGMQAIQTAVQLTVGHDEELIVPTPAWPNISGAAAVMGARAVAVPMRERDGRWDLTADMLAAAATPATRAVFINSPANPTGWTASLDTLREILEFARERRLWIIADEIYARFVWTGERRAPSFLDIMQPDDRVLFVNTFSKNWAMTGWRLGWLHAPSALKATVENLIQYSTSGVATFLQRAGVAALDDGERFVEATIARARRGREIVSAALDGHDRVTYAAPDGAFYAFFRVDGLGSSRDASFALIDEALVGTAPGTAFGAVGEGFVRVCFLRSEDSLAEAMTRIGAFLSRR